MAPQREWFETDYYAVLGVAADAPAKDVTRARTASSRSSSILTRTRATRPQKPASRRSPPPTT